jgi:hypothetical protein
MDNVSKVIVEHKEIGKYQDSLDIGSATKGGNIKVYVNANDLTEAKVRFDNMLALKSYANQKVNENGN